MVNPQSTQTRSDLCWDSSPLAPWSGLFWTSEFISLSVYNPAQNIVRYKLQMRSVFSQEQSLGSLHYAWDFFCEILYKKPCPVWKHWGVITYEVKRISPCKTLSPKKIKQGELHLCRAARRDTKAPDEAPQDDSSQIPHVRICRICQKSINQMWILMNYDRTYQFENKFIFEGLQTYLFGHVTWPFNFTRMSKCNVHARDVYTLG